MDEKLAGGLGDVQVVFKEFFDGGQGFFIEGVRCILMEYFLHEHFAQGLGKLIEDVYKRQTESETAHYDATEEYVKKFEEAMDDDFNTADAIAAIFELVKYLNTHTSAENSKSYLQKCLDRLKTLCDILGLVADKKEELLDADIETLIAERQQARKEKNFARADEILSLIHI